MRVDIGRYRENYNSIFIALKDLSWEDRRKKISEIAAATHVPLIAVLHYCLEMFGSNAEVEQKLDAVKKFYQVTEVVGAKPWA